MKAIKPHCVSEILNKKAKDFWRKVQAAAIYVT